MKYVGRKLVTMLITLLCISFLVYLAFDIIPGDAALAMLGTDVEPERLEVLREQMGLNKPFLERYALWLSGFVKGDFGTSYKYNMPVRDMILSKLPITITMALISFAIMVVVSLPIGIYTAKHSGKWVDRVLMVVIQIMMSVPHFFMGILITYVFGLVFKLFTPGGFISYETDFGGFMKYLIFPCIAIALPKIAMSVKLLRSSCIEEAKKDYTRTAYSKGNNTNKVLYKHVLRNAMIPIITLWGMTLADMLVGSIVIEQVFNIPGIGRILLTSISYRDYPVVETIIVLIAFVVIAANFCVDIIYQIVDPRISIDEKGRDSL
ncbi:MAG: ABC transporter permease [Lachnospiraceae bacterium]|jgi:peptide/nickel transport system permease protein|nr:ABC transporter permease [Lachnospiraceae bacterium]MCI9399384.1 ABC transporter permease [Lachnospiraceae bacterium]